MTILYGKKNKKTREEIEQFQIWGYKKALYKIKTCKERKSNKYDYESITEQMAWHIKQTHTLTDKDVVIVGKYNPKFLLQDHMITQCAYKVSDLTPYRLKRLITLGKHVNLYITNNNYKTNYKRISAYVDSAECLALDIDYYNIASLRNMPAEDVYNKICKEVFNPLGITPSYGIDSGNGLYIFFLLEYLPLSEKDKNNRYLYSKIMNALITVTKSYGADPNCKDFARVLRLPLTVNQKTDRPCKIIDFDIIKHSEPKRYHIEDLFKTLLPNAPLTEPKTKKAIPKPKKISSHKTPSTYKFSLNSLGQSRVKDLLHLLHLRKGDMEGFRNIFLFILSLSVLEYLYDVPDQAEQFLLEVNEQFIEPLPEKEVKTVFSHAYESISKRIKGETGYYHYSNDLIILKLDITYNECKDMKTIISTRVKYDRNNKRRRDNRRNENGKTKRQQSKEDKLNKIQQLLNEGKKQCEIAKILGVSNGLVSKYKKELNEKAL